MCLYTIQLNALGLFINCVICNNLQHFFYFSFVFFLRPFFFFIHICTTHYVNHTIHSHNNHNNDDRKYIYIFVIVFFSFHFVSFRFD